MTEFNGHRSWNAWNVSLWIGNDEGLYLSAVEALHSTHTIRKAVNVFYGITGLNTRDKTRDGAIFNKQCVTEALLGLEIEQPKREYDRRR